MLSKTQAGGWGGCREWRVGELVAVETGETAALPTPALWCVRVCDGSVAISVREHATKLCQVLKFVTFIEKHNTVPFIVKCRVFKAALTLSLLYGCESLFSACTKPVIRLYYWAMKVLLGVRKKTSNLVCYAELRYPSLTDLLQHKRHNFFPQIMARKIYDGRPFLLRCKVTRCNKYACHQDSQ